MRKLRVAAIAVVVMVGLSGCTVLDTLGSAADEARISSALDGLEDELAKIPGVTSVTSSMPIRGDLQFDVSLTAHSDGLSETNQRVAVDAVAAVFTAPPFSEQPQASFTLSDGEGETEQNLTVIEFAGIDPAAVTAQLDYRDAFAEVVGVPVTLYVSPPEPEIELTEPFRSVSLLSPAADIDWAALRDLDDDFDGSRSWGFSGFIANDALPPRELEALVDEAAAGDAYVQWNAASDYLSIDVYSEKQKSDFEALPAWSRLVELIRLAQGAGISPDAVGASVGVGGGGNAYFGECDDPTVVGIAVEFAAALERAGIAGARPGQCLANGLL